MLRTSVIWKSGWWWVTNRSGWLLELLTELTNQSKLLSHLCTRLPLISLSLLGIQSPIFLSPVCATNYARKRLEIMFTCLYFLFMILTFWEIKALCLSHKVIYNYMPTYLINKWRRSLTSMPEQSTNCSTADQTYSKKAAKSWFNWLTPQIPWVFFWMCNRRKSIKKSLILHKQPEPEGEGTSSDRVIRGRKLQVTENFIDNHNGIGARLV